MYHVTNAFSYPGDCPQGCWRGLPSHEPKYTWGKWKENNMIVVFFIVGWGFGLLKMLSYHLFKKMGSLFLGRVFLSHLCVKCTKILQGNSLASKTVEKKYITQIIYIGISTLNYTLQIWITVALVSGSITLCRFSGSFFSNSFLSDPTRLVKSLMPLHFPSPFNFSHTLKETPQSLIALAIALRCLSLLWLWELVKVLTKWIFFGLFG